MNVGAGPNQQVARASVLDVRRSSWGLVLMTCHSHTGMKMHDAGFKAFSAGLGSSTTITAVELGGKYECLVCSYEWVHVLVCMRVYSVGVWMWWCGV